MVIKSHNRFGLSEGDVIIERSSSILYTTQKADLSRRVGKLMHIKPIIDMSAEERIQFAQAVNRTNTFDNLEEKYKAIILSAENNL